MSRLLDLQEQLLDTNAALAQLDRAAADEPTLASIAAMAASLRKRYQSLESAFLREAADLGLDVCSYRLFGERERPTAGGLANVLGAFQNLVSVVYGAIAQKAPRETAHLSARVVADTTFDIGYVFPGSLGIALTIPNERRLVEDSHLDEALNAIFDMAKATNSSQVLDHAKTLGPASIRALYHWAKGHVDSDLGVDIEWKRERLVRGKLLAQKPDFERLSIAIDLTSEETTEEITTECELVGADVTRRSFHLRLAGGEDIRGSFERALGPSQTVELPRKYRVTLSKTVKVKYSTGEEDTKYQLLKLDPVD